MVVAGLDFNVNPNVIGGMEQMSALCTKKEFVTVPGSMMRPFDSARAGTVLGDGGAALVLVSDRFLEKSLDNDDVYCEMAGFGQNCDAHHILRPFDDGAGLQSAMLMALQDANIDIAKGGDENAIDMINCHATSTPKGDASEMEALNGILARMSVNEGQKKDPRKALITATKGNTAHLVAGTAITESAFAIKSMVTGKVPAIRNLDKPGIEGPNYVTQATEKDDIEVVVKNGLCFGGVNFSAVFKKC